MANKTIEGWLLLFQMLQVAFLLLHDWVPLGTLSNRKAVLTVDSAGKLIATTLISAIPWALGLAFCFAYWPLWPHWVVTYLWITYGILLVGAIQAWWLPYLVLPDPERAARYRVRFAGTLKFLPERNGIAPDALHMCFHLTVVATLFLLEAL